MSSTRRTKGAQQGPRSQRIIASVRAATLHELGRVGYAQMSVDDVAQRAGVHKTTIYRRWPSKADLVVSLVDSQLDLLETVPNGASLRQDLQAFAAQVARNLEGEGGRALARVLMSNHPELLPVVTRARIMAMGRVRRAFERARERGELDEHADVDSLTVLAFYGVMHTILWGDGAHDDTALERILAPLVP